MSDRDPSSLRLAIVVDEACMRVFDAWEDRARVVALRVNPAVYDAIATARPAEVRRGYPLMLLGMELVPDEAVATYQPAVVKEEAC
jgi:hypothetical protein